MTNLYFTDPKSWDEARITVKAIRPSLTRLHHELHGEGDLQELWVATDSDVPRDAQSPPEGPNRHAQRCAARQGLCRLMDDSREHRERLAFMHHGKAHFEAARKLDDAGRPVDALNALISANYWMVRRKPGPRLEVMEYALDLARRNGWETLAYNIEVVQHAARQLVGK